MPSTHRRVAVAGVLTAAAIAVPAAALAAGSDTPHPKPPHAGATASASGKSEAAPPDLSRLASSAGISVSRLEAGLVAAKQAGGNNPAGITACAAAAGVSHATAHRIVATVFGSADTQPLTGPASTAVLASQLGVSRAAAQRALQQVAALDGKDGVNPAGAAFARIAHGLGVSPARLAAGLDAVKRSMAGQ